VTCSELTVYALRVQVNLDGYALPIKKLKGTESVESLDLSNKRLGVASAIVIASLIGVNNALTALDMSFNDLKDEGVSAVCEAIQSNKETKLASLNVKKNGIGPMGANAVAAMVAVTGALTHLSLVGNKKLGDEGVEALSVAIEQSKSLRTLDLSSDSECQPCSARVSTMFGPKGATALAKALAINSSLTQIEYAGSRQLFRHLLITCAFWFLCLQVAGQLPWSQGCHSVRGRLARQQLAQEGMFPYQPTPA
jgi:hypothetical protein